MVANKLSKFLCTVWYGLVAHALLPLLYPYLRLPMNLSGLPEARNLLRFPYEPLTLVSLGPIVTR